MRYTTRRRASAWPPANERPSDRQGKVSHLLRTILNHANLNDFEVKFINQMGALINRRANTEPSSVLSEKQARTLRKIIFRKQREYIHALPRLPHGVTFEDEVRRLLKAHSNPNEDRNALIKKFQVLLQQHADEYRPEHLKGEMFDNEVSYVMTKEGHFVYKVTFDWWEEDGDHEITSSARYVGTGYLAMPVNSMELIPDPYDLKQFIVLIFQNDEDMGSSSIEESIEHAQFCLEEI